MENLNAVVRDLPYNVFESRHAYICALGSTLSEWFSLFFLLFPRLLLPLFSTGASECHYPWQGEGSPFLMDFFCLGLISPSVSVSIAQSDEDSGVDQVGNI